MNSFSVFTWLDPGEESISEFEDSSIEIIGMKGGKNTEQNVLDVWDIIKLSNIHLVGVTDRQEKEWGRETSVEVMRKNCPKVMKDIAPHIKEALNFLLTLE